MVDDLVSSETDKEQKLMKYSKQKTGSGLVDSFQKWDELSNIQKLKV